MRGDNIIPFITSCEKKKTLGCHFMRVCKNILLAFFLFHPHSTHLINHVFIHSQDRCAPLTPPPVLFSSGRLQKNSAGLRPQRRDLQHGVRRLLRPRDRRLRGLLSRRGAPLRRGSGLCLQRHPVPAALLPGLPARHAARSVRRRAMSSSPDALVFLQVLVRDALLHV